MRLVCPNCSAAYDVADDVIPPGGRYVQCSSCEKTWFEAGKSAPVVEETTEPAENTRVDHVDPPAPPIADPVDPPARKRRAPSDRKPLDASVASILQEEAAMPPSRQTAAADAVEEHAEDNIWSDTTEAHHDPVEAEFIHAPVADRKAVFKDPPMDDAETASAQALKTDAADTPVKAPPEPAVPIVTPPKPAATQAEKKPPAVNPDETRRRIAQMTRIEGEFPKVAVDATQPDQSEQTSKPDRKASIAAMVTASENAGLDAVPDIKEINATLRSRTTSGHAGSGQGEDDDHLEHRRGFRRGFFVVLAVFAAILIPYIFANQITQSVPILSGLMGGYVMVVDAIRNGLTGLMGAVIGNA